MTFVLIERILKPSKGKHDRPRGRKGLHHEKHRSHQDRRGAAQRRHLGHGPRP
nr:MAG TPA: hypothetical protein [Caudoviricetes sp.]